MNIFSKLSGHLGESLIAFKLRLSGYKGKLLRNIYLLRDDNTTTEIDLLYITRKGLVVIESKNYIGRITGNDTDSNWTVSLYKGQDFIGRNKISRYHFLNPIRQNKIHIKWLKKYLNKDIRMFSFVIFSTNGDLGKIDLSNSEYTYVFYTNELRDYLGKVFKYREDILTDEEVQSIYNKLKSYSNANRSIKKGHVKSIRKKKNDLICPVCKGKLVLRTAQRGKKAGKQFYGCSRYPKCKYTRNLAG